MKAILCTWDTFNLSAWNSLLLKECKFILLERWFTFVVEHQWTKHCEFICSCLRIVNKVKIITYLRVLLKSWEYSQSSEPIYLPNSLEGREMLASSVARPFPFHVKLRTLVSWNCYAFPCFLFIYFYLRRMYLGKEILLFPPDSSLFPKTSIYHRKLVLHSAFSCFGILTLLKH